MIKDKYYRIDKSVYCSFEGMQSNMDMHDIALKLSNDWWYKKDLYVLIVGMS